MGLKSNIRRELLSLSFQQIPGSGEREKTNWLALFLKKKGYNANALKKTKLGMTMFGWNPEFDDIEIIMNQFTLFLEIKLVKQKKEGYAFWHALVQRLAYKYYMKNKNINGDVLICMICAFQKPCLSDQEKYIAQGCGCPEEDIVIID